MPGSAPPHLTFPRCVIELVHSFSPKSYILDSGKHSISLHVLSNFVLNEEDVELLKDLSVDVSVSQVDSLD